MQISERRACKVVSIDRKSLRYEPKKADADKQLMRWLCDFSRKFPRWGYRVAHRLLLKDGESINRKRVLRLWRKAGLRVPKRRRKFKAPGTKDNACHIKQAGYPGHVWSYDFVMDATDDGRRLKILTLVDEYTREGLAIEVRRKMNAQDVLDVLLNAFERYGIPAALRSDNGGEFVAAELQEALRARSVDTYFIEPGSPWQNGFGESFNSILRNELLDCEIFGSLREARVLAEDWRVLYNTVRPHGSLGMLTPAEFKDSWKLKKAA